MTHSLMDNKGQKWYYFPDSFITRSIQSTFGDISIEGGEYDLVKYIIDNNWMNRIDDLQIQFHSFVDDSINKRNEIRKSLSKTHELTYDYEFVWENWKRK